MIFVTVGMQLGFDRLIKAMDQLAPSLHQPIIAQSGKGSHIARNLTQHKAIAPVEFEKLVGDAQIIVSHAGIGTILAAQRASKPIVLFPRRAAMGEHRNNHQLATCRQLDGRQGIGIAYEEQDLLQAIREGLNGDGMGPSSPQTAHDLELAVRRFVRTGAL